MVPLKLLELETVTIEALEDPASIVMAGGLAEMRKSGVTVMFIFNE